MTRGNDMEPISIYIHIPMCVKKCAYCDFTSFCGRMKQREAYTEAVCREMREQAAFFGARRVETVFFGGGTPTLMTGAQIGTAFHRMMRMLDFDALRAHLEHLLALCGERHVCMGGDLDGCDVLALGPGLGRSRETVRLGGFDTSAPGAFSAY